MSKFLLDTLLDVSTTMATSTLWEQSNSKDIKIIITVITLVKKKEKRKATILDLCAGLRSETRNKLSWYYRSIVTAAASL